MSARVRDEEECGAQEDTKDLRSILWAHYQAGEAEALVKRRLGYGNYRTNIYGGLVHVILYPLTLSWYLSMFLFRFLVVTVLFPCVFMSEFLPDLDYETRDITLKSGARKFIVGCGGAAARLLGDCVMFILIFTVVILVFAPTIIGGSFLWLVVAGVVGVPLDVVLLLVRPLLSVTARQKLSLWFLPSACVFADASYYGLRAAICAHCFLGLMPQSSPMMVSTENMAFLFPRCPMLGILSLPCIYFKSYQGSYIGMQSALVLSPTFAMPFRETLARKIAANKFPDNLPDIFLPHIRSEDADLTLLVWSIVYSDKALFDCFLQDAQSQIKVTILSLAGEHVLEPFSLPAMSNIGDVKRKIHEASLQADGKLKKWGYIPRECRLVASDATEPHDKFRLMRILPNDATLTLVKQRINDSGLTVE